MARHMHPWRTGKNLFDLLSQLPNFGVGRIVTRGKWLHQFPNEPCYYRITRVKVDCTKPELNSGEAWGIPTMRGYSRPNNEAQISSAWKREWKLIRKSEEDEFTAYTPKETDFHEVPTHCKVPPLLAEMMKRDQQAQGQEVRDDEPILMKLKISQGFRSRAYQMSDKVVVMDETVQTDV
ncbi:small ribosomal subunit protein mS34-like [Amphiura filiformis]|uniref:small ribosomal subunit protein mS34-like n=1 Tax=Amphiura filiformis TaxID=82378 RepID=UPI003B20DA23